MRYTLRSSNSSNLQGPLKFKRDKPLLETIEEVEEEYVSNNNLKLIIMLQLVCFCIVCYYIKENPIKDFIRYICYYIKENPIKDFIHYFYNYVCLFKFTVNQLKLHHKITYKIKIKNITNYLNFFLLSVKNIVHLIEQRALLKPMHVCT
jgi:hypothetical protein